MSNQIENRSFNENEHKNVQEQNSQKKDKTALDSSQVVNPSEDLVYKGGYTNEPEEILSNPAVAPQMLDDRRDLRSDLTRDPEEA